MKLRFIPFLVGLFCVPGMAVAQQMLESQDHTYGMTRFSHHTLALSPDAARFAVAGSDGVKIYATVSGKLIESRQLDVLQTRALAWSRDGKLAASGVELERGKRGWVCIWDAAGKGTKWASGGQAIEALAWSPDGKILASAAKSGSEALGIDVWAYGNDAVGRIQLWNPQTRALIRTLPIGEADSIALGFSPDGARVGACKEAVLDDEETPKADLTLIFNVQSGKKLAGLKARRWPFVWENGVPQSQSVVAQTRLSSGALARVVRRSVGDVMDHYDLWAQVQSGKTWRDVANLGGDGWSIAMRGDVLIAPFALFPKGADWSERALSEQNVGVWKWTGQKLARVAVVGENRVAIHALEGAKNGEILGIGARKRAILWGQHQSPDAIEIVNGSPFQALSHDEQQFSLDESGKTLFDGRVLDLKSRKIELEGEEFSYESIKDGALSPDGSKLWCWSGLFDLQTGVFKTYAGPGPGGPEDQQFFNPAWSRDGAFVALTTEGNAQSCPFYAVFDRTGKARFRSVEGSYNAVAWGPNRELAISGSNEDHRPYVQLREALSGKLTRSFALPQSLGDGPQFGHAGHLEFSGDGKTLAVTGLFWNGKKFAGALLLFDVESGKQIAREPFPASLYEILHFNANLFAWLGNNRLALLQGGDEIAIFQLQNQALRLESVSFWRREKDTVAVVKAAVRLHEGALTH